MTNDIELMLAFQNGDEGAFNALYHSYKKRIVHYIYRFFQNQDLAEELSHEVFLRIYKARDRYEPSAKFSTWIYHIATNICLNERRRAIHHAPTYSMDQPMADGETPYGVMIESSDPSQHDILETSEIAMKIKGVIAKLPKRQRAAFILSRYYGHSYEEIAEELNCSVKAVKSLLSRTKEPLLALLKDIRKPT